MTRPRLRPIPAPSWMQDAACVGIPDPFFPEPHGSAAAALRVCKGCPVKAQCLETALTNREVDGIWGGTTPSQRRALRKTA